jgi:methylated-DNA-[protein]-cysteine S-methyltransferase
MLFSANYRQKMQKKLKYSVFKTKWGYFGLAGMENSLCRCQLPEPSLAKTEILLLSNLPDAHFDKNYLKNLQEKIAAYFEGVHTDFSVNVNFNGLSNFGVAVLTACRNIKFGQTATYASLAEQSGRPAASRAVGNILAKNPLPLIIPCHRVLRSDGQIGGFSATGGTNTKQKLLLHEGTRFAGTQTIWNAKNKKI